MIIPVKATYWKSFNCIDVFKLNALYYCKDKFHKKQFMIMAANDNEFREKLNNKISYGSSVTNDYIEQMSLF